MKILLLNPPAKKLYLRDVYCSESSKASYYWAPIDLLALSGTLSKEHRISVLDANVLGLSKKDALRRIKRFNPDAVVSLVGAAVLENDFGFLDNIKNSLGCKIYGSGDALFFKPREVMQRYPFLDGALLDFTSDSILNLLKGRKKAVKDIVYRDGSKVIFAKKSGTKTFSYPMPRHELFPLNKYRMPFSKYRRTSTVLSNFGCLFNCSFCACGNVPYKERSVDEFIEELRYVDSLVKEAYFRDLTFGPSKKRIKEICTKIIKEKIDLVWSCEARIDTVDEECLRLMKKAGCYLIMLGVESANQKTLKRTSKNITTDQTKKVFDSCRKIGIGTLAFMIIGFPWDTKESIQRTIKFSKEINPDYVSFNLFVYRLGTKEREKLISQGKREDDFSNLDVSSDIIGTPSISKKELGQLYKQAVLGFYLRPKQILRLMRKNSLSNLLDNGFSVIKSVLRI